jgi:hypothetical protein
MTIVWYKTYVKGCGEGAICPTDSPFRRLWSTPKGRPTAHNQRKRRFLEGHPEGTQPLQTPRLRLKEKIMVQITTLRRRAWAGMAWLLVVSAGLLVALALGNTIVLLSMLAMAALVGLLLLRRQAPALAPAQPAAASVAEEPRVQRCVLAADGTARQALLAPAAAVDGYQTVLTIDGYALVNAEGRVVYALNRESHAQTSEPVVVTILDTEVAAR